MIGTHSSIPNIQKRFLPKENLIIVILIAPYLRAHAANLKKTEFKPHETTTGERKSPLKKDNNLLYALSTVECELPLRAPGAPTFHYVRTTSTYVSSSSVHGSYNIQM